MARIRWTYAGGARSLDLASNLAVIGTDAACTVALAGAPDVSPVHCELRRGPDGWRVVDLESRAGTRVNGEFVNTRALRSGDVIDAGGVQIVFEDDAAAPTAPVLAAPGAPVVARRGAAPVPAARRAAPVSRRRAALDEDDEEALAEEDDARGTARRGAGATTAFWVVGGVLGAVLVAVLFAKLVLSETRNDKIRAQMVQAEQRHEWQRMLDLAATADQDLSYDYAQIQVLAAQARDRLKGEAAGTRVDQSIEDWSQILYWRQSHRGEDSEFLRRIDAYLAQYAGFASEGVLQAKAERVKLTGTSSTDPGWATLADDLRALETDGRFGAALAKVDEWWTANETKSPERRADIESERKRLHDAAEKWFAKQVALAHHYWGNGEKKKAERTLDQAQQKIGLPGYDGRAMDELARLRGGK